MTFSQTIKQFNTSLFVNTHRWINKSQIVKGKDANTIFLNSQINQYIQECFYRLNRFNFRENILQNLLIRRCNKKSIIYKSIKSSAPLSKSKVEMS